MRLKLFALHLAMVLFIYFPSNAQQESSQTELKEEVESPKFKIVSKQYEDWTYQCLVANVEKRPNQALSEQRCEVSQSVQREQDGTVVEIINISVTRANDKAGKVEWALVVLAPLALNVHLPSDFGLIVGKAKPFLTRFRNCTVQGCQVIIPAKNSLLKNFKRANSGAARFRLLSGQVVEVKFSLSGFTKAFKALNSGNPPTVQVKQNKGLSQ